MYIENYSFLTDIRLVKKESTEGVAKENSVLNKIDSAQDKELIHK